MEQLLAHERDTRSIGVRIREKALLKRAEAVAPLHRRRLRNDDFTVISDDCFGAEIYRHLGLPYNTPFVGGFMFAPCFLRILTDLRGYLEGPVEWLEESRYEKVNEERAAGLAPAYPIAVLRDGAEIHYNHYEEREARERFERRVPRINYDNLFIKTAADRNLWTIEELERFDALPYSNKLCVSGRDLPTVDCAVKVRWYSTNGTSLFSITLAQFDLIGWLNGTVHPAP